MINRLTFALVRAVLVVLLVATPSLLLPTIDSDTNQVVVLVCIFAGWFTLFEYASVSPGLIDFRGAPPFNRIRFGALFIMVFALSAICRDEVMASPVGEVLRQIGLLFSLLIEFPYSPVRLLENMLPETAELAERNLLRATAGLAYMIGLVATLVFAIVMRLKDWPTRNRSFNVWVNLPTFDPNGGGDVVDRLERDSRVNIALGFLLPFVVPFLISVPSGGFGTATLADHQAMVWAIAAWSFFPASLIMRGIAMGRIAAMIEMRRRESSLRDNTEFLPA